MQNFPAWEEYNRTSLARYQTEQISPEQQMKPTSMCLNTPSIARICPQSVEVVTMPKGKI